MNNIPLGERWSARMLPDLRTPISNGMLRTPPFDGAAFHKFGLVADLSEPLPELIDKLPESRVV